MPITDSQRAKIEQLIRSELKKLHQACSLSAESSETVELDQAVSGRVSRIDAIQQQKMAQANLQRDQLREIQLNRTLEKLTDQYFGECEECGSEINFERLLVRPESRYCIDCQSQLERC